MGTSIQNLEGRNLNEVTRVLGKELKGKEWRDMSPEERDSHLIKYHSREYKEEYNQMLVEHMATGRSYETFCCTVECDISLLYRWEEYHPAFYQSKKIAFHKCLKYWENILIDATSDRIKSNASLLIFKLKNSFPDIYSDKIDVNHSGNVVFNFDTGIKRTPLTIETEEYTILNEESDML